MAGDDYHNLNFDSEQKVELIRDNKQLVVEKTNVKFIEELSDRTLQKPSIQLRHPLLTAALEGQLDVVKYSILEEKLNIETTDDQVGRSALHHACTFGQLEMVTWLIEAGANVTAKTNDSDYNDTPVHLAAYFGHLPVVRFLIEQINEEMIYWKNGWGQIPMLRASVTGQLDVLKYFIIEKKVNIDTVDDRLGRTALHNASGKGHLEVVKWLVEVGANWQAKANDSDYNGMPIHVAAETGQLKVVRFFIEKVNEKMIYAENDDGSIPMLRAALCGQLPVVKYFINERKVEVDFKDQWGRTALQNASVKGNLEVVQWLITAGANVNVKAKWLKGVKIEPFQPFRPDPVLKMWQEALLAEYYTRTALHYSSESGYLEVVKSLIQAGADVKIESNTEDGKAMPVHLAAEFGNLSVVKFFIEEIDETMSSWKNGYGELPMHRAAFGGQTLVVQYFINEKVVNLEAKDDRLGRTALHYASLNGNLELVKWLVQAGANIGATSNTFDGQTMPIHVAAQLGKLPVVKFFVEEVDEEMVNWKNGDGEIPMLRAALDGKLDVLKYFIADRKVNIDTKDDRLGRTALHYAILKDKVDMVKWLVQNGANVEARSNDSDDNSMPIHVAAKLGHLELVKFFIHKVDEAMTYWKNGEGDIPMLSAARNGKLDVVKYFITEENVNIETKGDRWGRTALHYVCTVNELGLVRWLIQAGANPRASSNESDFNSMPIHLAAEFGRLDLVMFFIEEVDKTMVFCENRDGDIPMLRAAVGGKTRIVEYFIDKCDLKVETAYPKNGKTALHDASGESLSREFLIEFMTNVDAKLQEKNYTRIALQILGRNRVGPFRPVVIAETQEGNECCLIL